MEGFGGWDWDEGLRGVDVNRRDGDETVVK